MLFCEMLWEGVPVFVRRFDRTGFHPAFTAGHERFLSPKW